MTRVDLINGLIQKYGLKKYCEIGLDNPNGTFTKINCELKHSVDPFFEEDHKTYDYSYSNIDTVLKYLTHRMTSDEFFETTDEKYDIFFIDGLHTQEQVGKDIINALKHLNSGGFIVVHDCIPHNEAEQIVPRKSVGWTGDVWKAIPQLEKQGIDYKTVDTDWGCCVIKYKENPDSLVYPEVSTYTWNDFVKNKKDLLKIISVDEFRNLYL